MPLPRQNSNLAAQNSSLAAQSVGCSAAQPPQQVLTIRLISDLEFLIDHSKSLVIRARNLGDRLFGANPDDKVGVECDTPPGDIAQISNRMDTLKLYISLMDHELIRLERVA